MQWNCATHDKIEYRVKGNEKNLILLQLKLKFKCRLFKVKIECKNYYYYYYYCMITKYIHTKNNFLSFLFYIFIFSLLFFFALLYFSFRGRQENNSVVQFQLKVVMRKIKMNKLFFLYFIPPAFTLFFSFFSWIIKNAFMCLLNIVNRIEIEYSKLIL